MTRGGRICFLSSFRSRRSAAALSRRLCTRMSSTMPSWSTARHTQCFWPAIFTATSSRCHLSPARGSRGSVQRLGVCGGGDMTGRAVSGWGIVDGLSVAAGRNARGRRDAQCRGDGARIHALLPSFESEPARKLRRALDAVDRYLRSQSAPLVDYTERHRAGLRVGTSLIAGTANFLVNRRIAKSQQMRWSRRGADRLLQVRCALYNGTLGTGFGQQFLPTNDPHPPMAVAA